MLVKAIASFKKMQVASSADMADALIGVGRVALARKENAQALHSFKEAYEFWNKVDPGNVWAAESAYWYGNALLAAGDSKRGTAMMADARLNLQKAQIPMLRELATK
jgi:beta-lactamase class D